MRVVRPPKPGAFRTVQVGPRASSITRSRKGEIRAFFNVCRHRGAKLCTKEAGEVSAGLPVPVPRLDLRPRRQARRRAEPHQDAGRRPRTSTACGRCTSGNGSATCGCAWRTSRRRSRRPCCRRSSTGSVRSSRIDHYDVDNLSVGRRIVYDVQANWKLIIENFMECYHCATIHPELTEVLPEFADGYAAQYFVEPRRRVRRGRQGFHHRRVRGPGPYPGHRPPTRTAGTTRSRSSRRCSSTWCPTT